MQILKNKKNKTFKLIFENTDLKQLQSEIGERNDNNIALHIHFVEDVETLTYIDNIMIIEFLNEIDNFDKSNIKLYELFDLLINNFTLKEIKKDFYLLNYRKNKNVKEKFDNLN